MSKIQEVEVEKIIVNGRIHDEESVNALAASILQVGQLHQIGCVVRDDGEIEIAYGRGRLQAVKKLGMKTIEAKLYDTTLDAKLAEIDENVVRSDKLLDVAESRARRVALRISVEIEAPSDENVPVEPIRDTRLRAVKAEAMSQGVSVETINQAITLSEGITLEVKQVLLPVIEELKTKELLEIAKLPEDEKIEAATVLVEEKKAEKLYKPKVKQMILDLKGSDEATDLDIQDKMAINAALVQLKKVKK